MNWLDYEIPIQDFHPYFLIGLQCVAALAFFSISGYFVYQVLIERRQHDHDDCCGCCFPAFGDIIEIDVGWIRQRWVEVLVLSMISTFHHGAERRQIEVTIDDDATKIRLVDLFGRRWRWPSIQERPIIRRTHQ